MVYNFFKKTKKIEFVSLVPGVQDAYPVTPASNFRPKWTELALSDYKRQKDNGPNFNHIALCPGIFDLYKTGFIVPMWHDIMVKTDGDGKTYQYAVPNYDGLQIDGVNQPVGKHTDDIIKYLPKRPHSLSGVIKFNTPWRIIAPKNVKFLMLPVPYDDNMAFDASIGLLDPAVSNEINVQVYWNVLNGEHKVKAGTPLCYLLPLTEDKIDFVIRDATEHDLSWEKKKSYMMSSNFFPARKKLAEMWYNHFKIK